MADKDRAAAQQGAEVPPEGGFVAGTPVLTLDGELPVQFLAPGDRVVTRTGARVIEAVEVRLASAAPMVRILPSALGRDLPEEQLFVAPGQRLNLPDWAPRAERPAPLCGPQPELAPGFAPGRGDVAAGRLADGDAIRRETVAEVRLYALRFARDEVIYAAGVELCCPAVAPAAAPASAA